MKVRLTIISIGFLYLVGCNSEPKTSIVQSTLVADSVDFSLADNFYKKNIIRAVTLLDSLQKIPLESPKSKEVFRALRIAFKKAEPYASYLNADVGHRANGPALPVFREDTGKVLNPFGLQKIEESIYDGGTSQATYNVEIDRTRGLLLNLQNNIMEHPLTAQRFFIATHQQLFRIISLGISGFDTPVSYLGINECVVSLESLAEVYRLTVQSIIEKKNKVLHREFLQNIEKANSFIRKNTNFETFDRYSFIRDHMNPITRNWVSIRKESGIWEVVNNKPFNFDAPTFFEEDSFNVAFFRPINNRNPSQEQIDLGKKLFYDPKLSSNGKMACASCHIPEKAFADGLKSNFDNKGNRLRRNTPTLLNSIYQQAYFWDGRSPKLEDQISEVFTNEKEFNSNVHEFSLNILEDNEYQELFRVVYGRVPTKNLEIIQAISSYVSTLNSFNSKFDRNMRGEEASFTEEERLGMNLFMGKALCATCHFIPLTNGTVPPFFKETEKEVIGVAQSNDNKTIDSDEGFYTMFEEEIHWGMFKTPTIRNAELTAPYMHNGAYNTLEEVMEFYNEGGGLGLGFDLEHQTLPFDNLQLEEFEISALISFVKTLTDLPKEKVPVEKVTSDVLLSAK